MRRLRPVLLLLLFGIMLSACGVEVATQPSATPLPDQLKLGSVTTTTTPPTRSITVYFIYNDRLFPARESYAVGSESEVEAALRALNNGPNATLQACGVTTAFPKTPAAISMVGSPNYKGLASIYVGSMFAGLPGVTIEQASAQIVYTLTGIDGITAVQFMDGGSVLPSYTSSGPAVDLPAYASDYTSLAPDGTHPCGSPRTSGLRT